jgi:hypothetical protein
MAATITDLRIFRVVESAKLTFLIKTDSAALSVPGE